MQEPVRTIHAIWHSPDLLSADIRRNRRLRERDGINWISAISLPSLLHYRMAAKSLWRPVVNVLRMAARYRTVFVFGDLLRLSFHRHKSRTRHGGCIVSIIRP